MSGEREAVEARAEQWMLEHGYRCAGVPLHYETESHVGYQYPHEFATEFSLAENAELLGRVKRAEQECDDWKMDVAARDKKVEAVQAKYETAMVDLCTAIQRAEAAEAEVVRLREQKDGAYAERDNLVCALSKLFPASLERHPDSDTTWEDDWRWIVFIDLPTGQATWHIHDSELAMFDHLPRFIGREWDGHTTPQKYLRLAALAGPQNGQWVRVEDRLPDDDSDVFAAIWWSNGDNSAYSHYVIHDCSYYEGGTGSGQKIFTDCEGEEFEHTDVSYWIYKKDLAASLPAPPTRDAPTEKK